MKEWIDQLFAYDDLCQMGHLQRPSDSNLGLGWIYYALARVIRPHTVVSIGSWRGFVPMVLARALKDNGEGGQVVFIDPSMVDDFWKDAEEVRNYFRSYGLDNIRHALCTTEEYVQTDEYRALADIGVLFVDGYHDAAHARTDFEAFEDKLAINAVTIFHDSVREFVSGLYGKDKRYVHDVYAFMQELKDRPDYQVMDFPFDSGMTIVRKVADPDHAAFSPRIHRVDGYMNFDVSESVRQPKYPDGRPLGKS